MNIQTFFKSEVYLECSYEDWEKIENKFYEIGYKHKNVELSSFAGCPAAGPYLTMISDSKKDLEKIVKALGTYLSKFKSIRFQS